MKELLKAISGNTKYNYDLKRTSLVDEVSDSLLKLILNKSLIVGEKLPSESRLTEIFGVSKLTIRLALQKLSGLGVIETRNGEGSFVTEFSIERYLDEASDIVYEDDMLNDVQTFRRIIEIPAGKLAIENASEEQIKELLEAANDMYYTKYDYNLSEEENLELYATKDFNVHLKLCEISNNKLLYLAFLSCKVAIKEYLLTIVRVRSRKDNDNKILAFPINSHAKMAEAIMERNYEKFVQLYDKMVNIVDAVENERKN